MENYLAPLLPLLRLAGSRRRARRRVVYKQRLGGDRVPEWGEVVAMAKQGKRVGGLSCKACSGRLGHHSPRRRCRPSPPSKPASRLFRASSTDPSIISPVLGLVPTAYHSCRFLALFSLPGNAMLRMHTTVPIKIVFLIPFHLPLVVRAYSVRI